jgi:predicted dienelactone hydrolase
VVDLVLHDKIGDKDLPPKVRYPTNAAGPVPVIVFSHDAGGSGGAFPDLTEHRDFAEGVSIDEGILVVDGLIAPDHAGKPAAAGRAAGDASGPR